MLRTTTRNTMHVLVTCLLLATACSPAAHASVVMSGTRFVYAANAKEITVKVSNVGKLPALTQAWIDAGDATAAPEHIDVPFNLTPPISRIEAGKSQTLRIGFTGADLPADRESQFWLNVLEVPPKASEGGEDTNRMQLAFRYRLKLFYRPADLAGTADQSPDKVTWSRTRDGGVSAANPTPYHVTYNDVVLKVDGRDVAVEPFAIAPMSAVAPRLVDKLPAAATLAVDYQSINDYGGFVKGHKDIVSP